VSEPILCYVSGVWAFFTTQALEDQWGDDWNDAPYEHNAGHPYEAAESFHYFHRESGELRQGSHWTDGKPNWVISRVAFDGPLESPCDDYPRRSLSVEDINRRKQVPWLIESKYSHRPGEAVKIWAGTPLSEFRLLAQKAGGTVYEAVEVEGVPS